MLKLRKSVLLRLLNVVRSVVLLSVLRQKNEALPALTGAQLPRTRERKQEPKARERNHRSRNEWSRLRVTKRKMKKKKKDKMSIVRTPPFNLLYFLRSLPSQRFRRNLLHLLFWKNGLSLSFLLKIIL
eukprot:Gregarina_sp_Poly_1__2661@NODE_1727_length_3450_cov_8_163464_g1129_i0_p2_GENE_NODE_1727_length_3450_cov_8_163464_g1129_i0NODE_1727_length_3450_cov_8_163464_g1129_i0_p2_ORF_typecomplete_len128_score17_62SpoVR/PF04293_13/0_11_NODE_1727_length_3450_cov_8_163464_g1129_i011091492